MRAKLVVATLMLALAGCGKVAPLEPAAGERLPVKSSLAPATPTSEDLLRLPPYARPERVDDLLRKGERRKADPFDLPPPDGATAPATDNTVDNQTQPQGTPK